MNLPPYFSHPILQAGEYTLRPILHADIAYIVDLSFWDGKPAETIEQAIAIQALVDEDYLKGNSINWGITDATNTIVGTCGYNRGFKGFAGEIGFVLKEKYRGKGIMRQAIASVIQFGKETMKLNYIFSITDANNTNAIKLFEKINAVKIKVESGQIEYQLFNREAL
jgi:ribosomal-protein-alanine N-acetyltransferase